jgi:hypothetical protein
MKKFSGISKVKVNEEPKQTQPSKEEVSKIELKNSIMDLMNDFLRIVSLGGARKNILPHVQIDGKDLFVEALLDLLSSKEYKDKIVALETLKSESQDWASIDSQIDLLQEKEKWTLTKVELKNQILKIENLLKIYEGDSFIVQTTATSLDKQELDKRLKALDHMIHSDRWSNIKSQLVKLQSTYSDKISNL